MNLVHHDDPVLHTAAPVYTGDVAQLRAVAAQMHQIMNVKGGIGLAAPQVGLPLRMFIMDLTHPVRRKFRNAYICINPVILRADPPLTTELEGCLSWPGRQVNVERHTAVRVEYLDLHGKRQQRHFFGLLARCFQHELEHLDGINITTRRERKEAA